MKTLFLDLASHASSAADGACIACVSNDETVSLRFIHNRIGDSGILPVLEEVVTEAAWTPNDLTNIACVTGPGGFTSLRMAVTLANTYADQLRVPVAGVHLSDLYGARVALQAASCKPPEADLEADRLKPESFVWLHSTKKTHVFIRGFGQFAAQWKEPTLISVEELVASLPEQALLTGEVIPEHRAALEVKQVQYLPVATLANTLPSFLVAQQYTSNILVPWYGRGW